MSILYIDGFDHYNIDGHGGRKLDQGANGSTHVGGRWGGSYLIPGTSGNLFISQWDGTHKTIPHTHELIVGFAAKFDSFDQEHPFLLFMDGKDVQCSLHISSATNTIILRTSRGLAITDITLGDTGYVPLLTLWFYLEVKVKIEGSTGSCEIRANGQTILNLTNIPTQQTGHNYTNKVGICGLTRFNANYEVDDLYFMNTEDGLGRTDFLGELRVQSQFVDANGSQNDFVPSAGSNYQNVQETLTSYIDWGRRNTSSTLNALDLYSITDFIITGTIFAVQGDLIAQKEDVGARTTCPVIRTLSSNYEGNATQTYSSYTYSGQMWEKNPATNSTWTLTDLNSAEFGIKIKT